VYCGHEYPDQTPTSGAEVLTAHIKAVSINAIHALLATMPENNYFLAH